MRGKGERLARSWRGAFLRSTILVVCLLASVSCYTMVNGLHWNAISKDPVEISGEFAADGTCSVSANGIPLFAPEDSARTTYQIDYGANMAPRGYNVHMISCVRHASGPRSAPGGGLFFLMFSVKDDAGPAVGTYAILPGAALSHGSLTMDGAYNDPTHFGIGAPGSGHRGDTGKVRLETISGSAVYTRLERAGVVGTFHYRAVRKWAW